MSDLKPKKLTLVEQYLLNSGHKRAYSDDSTLISPIDLRDFKADQELSRNRIAELSTYDSLTKTRANNVLNFLDTLAEKYVDPEIAKTISELDGSLGRACSKLMFFLDDHFYNGVSEEAQSWEGYKLEKTQDGVIFRALDDEGQEKYRYEYSHLEEDFDKTILYIADEAKVKFISELQSLNKDKH
jgi:hypothetical protein